MHRLTGRRCLFGTFCDVAWRVLCGVAKSCAALRTLRIVQGNHNRNHYHNRKHDRDRCKKQYHDRPGQQLEPMCAVCVRVVVCVGVCMVL